MASVSESIARLNREKWQFGEERRRHSAERDRLDKEVERLRRQLQTKTDGKKRKQLQDDISLTKAKKELANSKAWKANALSNQKYWELEEVWGVAGAEGEIQRNKKRAEEWEDKVKKILETITNIEMKREQYEASNTRLLEALQHGFVTVVMLLCIVQGLPGVGKTHLKFLLLDQEPPHLRTSTNCAEAPVRIEIGTVTGTRIKTIGGRWQVVDDEDMFDVVAEMILLAEPESISEVDHLEEVYFETPNTSRKHKVPKKPKPTEMTKPSENPKSPENDTLPEKPKPSNSVLSRILSWMKGNRTSTDEKSESPREESSKTAGTSAAQPVSSNVSNPFQKAMDVIMDKLVHCITKMKGRMNAINTSQGRFSLKSRWVYFNDSGGQPEYHELLPLFVRRISSALCVIRLPDKLDETQKVEYYKDGKRIGDVQRSQFTAKDTVQCLVNTIQSYSNQDEPPKIIVVGTHLDQLKEQSKETISDEVDTDTQEETTTDQTSTETLEEKNRQLIDMLERDFSDQLVYYSESSTTKELIFPLNTLKPGEHEKAVAESLRYSIESSGAKEVQVPIWWHIMELLLEELSKILGRGVLSRAECLEMACLLKIEEEEFDAALVYFDELNVIKYSPDSLRNTVFIKSQIPLDKVSELVYHSYLLRQPTTALSEEWRHFRDRGVVSKEVLKTFPSHYVDDVFSVDDLVEYLKQLLVLAPIPKPVEASSSQSQSTTSDQPSSTTSAQSLSSTASDQQSSTTGAHLSSSITFDQPLSSTASARSSSTTSDQPSSSTPKETHYIMPTLWKTVPEADLESRRIYSPVAATLLVRFPRRFRRAGVFCCFVVHLIRYCGWDLLLETKEPLYRNCIELHLQTSPPLTVVLIDSNTHIEVHVNASSGIPVSEYTGLLPIIKQAILSGIFSACRALKYTQTKPHLTFYCPHTQPSSLADDAPKSKVQHTATLTPNRKYWSCDLDPKTYFGPLENHHKIWFGIPQASESQAGAAKRPTTIKKPSKSTSLAHPTSRSLTFIEWRNEQGKKERFRLKEQICNKWHELGCLLEVPLPVLSSWEKKHLKDDLSCINEVLCQWLEEPTDYYPDTWEGLYSLLDHANLNQIAEDLKRALSNAL